MLQGTSTPKVYDYRDYRFYLKDWFTWKKQAQPGYSGAIFARQAGINAHTLLGMVIRGNRNLTYSSVRAFSKALSLKDKDKIFFEKLVFFNQAKNSEEKGEYFQELVFLSQKLSPAFTECEDYASLFSNWFVTAIREMVHLHDFEPSGQWISKRLKRKITPREAENAWNLLLDKKFVIQDSENGQYKVADPNIDVEPGIIDFAIRNYHKKQMNLAINSVDESGLEERELSSLTLALSDEQLKKLRTKIQEFRKSLNLNNTVGPNEQREHVVVLNTQLLKLTAKGNYEGGINEEVN